jgi:hypothetical protein
VIDLTNALPGEPELVSYLTQGATGGDETPEPEHFEVALGEALEDGCDARI